MSLLIMVQRNFRSPLQKWSKTRSKEFLEGIKSSKKAKEEQKETKVRVNGLDFFIKLGSFDAFEENFYQMLQNRENRIQFRVCYPLSNN